MHRSRIKRYYQGRHAQNYNRQWRAFSERTLNATLTSLEQALAARPSDRQRRILDVGCGTGLLLRLLADRFPEAELVGVDASPDMLEHAHHTLKEKPHVQLRQVELGADGQPILPCAPGTFDLITCTNTFHYFTEPVVVLQTWREVLVEGGQVLVEDYTLRRTPVPWNAFEWAIKLYDPQHVRLYPPSTVQVLSQQAGFQVLHTQTFSIDFFCQGWVVHLVK
ncbi:MAG: class I SAM-dependent methyltransferase [Chloroflexota bacterium]|nr:class I SAM-dependent methyltransferase [Chloroflexota bacterium]